jgi:hypothetical protein
MIVLSPIFILGRIKLISTDFYIFYQVMMNKKGSAPRPCTVLEAAEKISVKEPVKENQEGKVKSRTVSAA